MMTELYQTLHYPSDIGRYDVSSRRKKADKIINILQMHNAESGLDADLTKCLDVGCGPGIITDRLVDLFDVVVGIDLDEIAIDYGKRFQDNNNLTFTLGNVQQLPISDQTFDVAICAQVYEHVPDPVTLATEIWRVLKPGGVCFFSGPNRLALMEEHYFLPFLSWLPQSLADMYVRLSKRGESYDAFPRYPWQVKSLWRNFECHDYTLEIIRDPDRFGLNPNLRRWSWITDLPSFILNVLMIGLPNYNWVLTKPYVA